MNLVRFFSLRVVIALSVLLSGLAVFAGIGLKLDVLNIRNIDLFPEEEQGTSQSEAPEEPLLFGVFTFANDTESISVLKQQYSSNDRNHYVIQSIRSAPAQLWLYDALATHRKLIIVQSLDNITSAIKIGQNYDLDTIVYDIEQWERTPESERVDPSASISKGADIVHEAGYRYGITPDAVTLMDSYKKIDWAEIDLLSMQLQRFSQNITEYSNIAKEVSTFVSSKNPNIEIFTQLSYRFTNATEMIKIIESVKDIVNGFIIFHNPESNLCKSSCSPHELNLVLDRINSLKHKNNNHAIS